MFEIAEKKKKKIPNFPRHKINYYITALSSQSVIISNPLPLSSCHCFRNLSKFRYPHQLVVYKKELDYM